MDGCFQARRSTSVHSECYARDESAEIVWDAVNVLANIDPSSIKMRKHLLKRYHLMQGVVATVIDKNVQSRYFLSHLGPKSSIGLVSDQNFDALGFINLTRFFDVYAINL